MFTLWMRNIYGSMHKRTFGANNVCMGDVVDSHALLFNPHPLA